MKVKFKYEELSDGNDNFVRFKIDGMNSEFDGYPKKLAIGSDGENITSLSGFIRDMVGFALYCVTTDESNVDKGSIAFSQTLLNTLISDHRTELDSIMINRFNAKFTRTGKGGTDVELNIVKAH